MGIYQYPFHSKFITGTLFGVKGNSWKCGYHSGVDFLSRNHGGDGMIYPIAPGVVESLNTHGTSYGRHICIKHPDGIVSLCAHLEYISVEKGQKVSYDTKLGKEGHTGNASGDHLHLEVHDGKYGYPAKIDPLAWIKNHLKEEEEDMEIKKVNFILPDKKQISVNGFLTEGTNYSAARPLLEALGYKVDWDGKNVIITK